VHRTKNDQKCKKRKITSKNKAHAEGVHMGWKEMKVKAMDV